MLVQRYLIKETVLTFSLVSSVILLISISNKSVSLFSKSLFGEIPNTLIWKLILFQIPELFAFLLPIALFLAILLCFGRLFAHQEMPVLLGCGLSWQRWVCLMLQIGVVVACFSSSVTLYWGPKLAQARERLLTEMGPLLLTQVLTPGRFHYLAGDNLVFYVGELSPDKHVLKNIFIAEQKSGSIITAKSGTVNLHPQTGLTYLELQEGSRYSGTPGQQDYHILHFDHYQRLLEEITPTETVLRQRTLSTLGLWQNPTLGNLAELQWRIAIPLAAILLALLAVPLSSIAPRATQSRAMVVGALICLIYFNLLTVSKRWILLKHLPAWIGLWWVHVLLLIIALVLLAHASGRARQCMGKISDFWKRRKN